MLFRPLERRKVLEPPAAVACRSKGVCRYRRCHAACTVSRHRPSEVGVSQVEPEQQSFLPPAAPLTTRQRIAEMARLKDAKRNNRLPSDEACALFDQQIDIEDAIQATAS